ncbi:MAG TPA: hypothetical protein VKR58_02310 [Aquella sp.]|nr:hypothetical protein [Aquella sp.]
MKQFFIYSSVVLTLSTAIADAIPTYGRCSFELDPYDKTDHKILLSINGAEENKMEHPSSSICKSYTIQYANPSTTSRTGSPRSSTHTIPKPIIFKCTLKWSYDPEKDQPSETGLLKGFTGLSGTYNDRTKTPVSILNALKNTEFAKVDGVKLMPLTMYTFNTWYDQYIASEIENPNCKKPEKFFLGATFRIIPKNTDPKKWTIEINTANIISKQTYNVQCELNNLMLPKPDDADSDSVSEHGDSDMRYVHSPNSEGDHELTNPADGLFCPE